MLGALLEETECLPPETAIAVLEAMVKNPKLLELDRQTITAGRDYVDTQSKSALSRNRTDTRTKRQNDR